MKLITTLRKARSSLPPQTWPETFAVIIGLDLAFLAAAYLLDWLKGVLTR